MDFNNLPQDEKIICLLNIFPEVDPIVINSLIDNNLDYDNLIISLLEISDPTFKGERNFIYPEEIYQSKINKRDIYPEIEDDKAIPSPKFNNSYNSSNISYLHEKKPKGEPFMNKLKSIKNNITDFIQSKTSRVNNRSQYSSVPTSLNWEDEDDDEVVLYDRNRDKNKKKDYFDDFL